LYRRSKIINKIEQLVDQLEAEILETIPEDIEQFQNYMRMAADALKKADLRPAAGVLLYGSALLALKKIRQQEMS